MFLPVLFGGLLKTTGECYLFHRPAITPSLSFLSDANSKPTLTIRPNADTSIALSTPTHLYTPTLLPASTPNQLTPFPSTPTYVSRSVTKLLPKEMPKHGRTITISDVRADGSSY
ncbi:hypothetical protein BDQ17DRAFT_1363801 [Cyathus striatus]|nr:hypothetical protein BDQ17DRAFT_1363801 [Cyathus striatus]